jgi:hypothetical protein
MATAVCTRVSTPSFSSASWRARALITVASIPMWSAEERSIPAADGELPRKMFPPPTTIPISVPSLACSSPISRATWLTIRDRYHR